ncbi:MAG: hypothetical protein ABI647_08760 [Gemmatimonadota bacterium]
MAAPRTSFALAFLGCLAAGLGCDALLPNAPPDTSVLDGPLEGLTGAQLATFTAGDREFGRVFSTADGLGPVFVAQACASCHGGDRKGHPLFGPALIGLTNALCAHAQCS